MSTEDTGTPFDDRLEFRPKSDERAFHCHVAGLGQFRHSDPEIGAAGIVVDVSEPISKSTMRRALKADPNSLDRSPAWWKSGVVLAN
jgi:hypothetical protein